MLWLDVLPTTMLGRHSCTPSDFIIAVEAALRLEISVEEEEELPLIWLLSATLLSIWEQRQLHLKVQPYLVRAQLEAKVNLLRETRHENCSTILDLKIQFMFDYLESQ